VKDFGPEAPPAKVTCRLRPLADHVVVLPEEAETVTDGGIIVPDTAKETPVQGTVLAVGPGRTEPGVGTVLPAVAVGDVVLFGRYSGLKVPLDGVEVLIMREEDVLGVLAPKADA
jgi:chaperonin GroES